MFGSFEWSSFGLLLLLIAAVAVAGVVWTIVDRRACSQLRSELADRARREISGDRLSEPEMSAWLEVNLPKVHRTLKTIRSAGENPATDDLLRLSELLYTLLCASTKLPVPDEEYLRLHELALRISLELTGFVAGDVSKRLRERYRMRVPDIGV